jgi:hypothetical protein
MPGSGRAFFLPTALKAKEKFTAEEDLGNGQLWPDIAFPLRSSTFSSAPSALKAFFNAKLRK